jgi:hypothetical protein
MLFIDDEPNKALGNPNWSGLFLKSFKGKLLKTKVQWLDLSSCLWAYFDWIANGEDGSSSS